MSRDFDRYIDMRKIGNAHVFVVNEANIRWAPNFPAPEHEWRQAMPEADDEGVLSLAVNVGLIQIDDAQILIDPALDDPDSAWQEQFARSWPGSTRTPGLGVALAEIGVEPADITHVLITHRHFDHLAGVTVDRGGTMQPRYPNALHVINRAEWTDNPDRHDPESEIARRLGPIERAERLVLIDGEYEVVPGVTMIPAPGETPGHMVVRVESEGEVFFSLGDLFHHGCEVEHVDWVSAGRDPEAMRASRERVIAEVVPSGATLVFAHEAFPPWGHIVESAGGFRWQRGEI